MSVSPARRLAMVSAAGAAGRRWRGYLAVLTVAIVAVVLFAAFPQLPLRHGPAGLLLAVVGLALALGFVGLPTPQLDGRWTASQVRGWTAIGNVVITPAAVLVVTETRSFRGSELAEVSRAARAVRSTLRTQRLLDVTRVVPVLVVRGAAATELPLGHKVEDDVFVVDGNHPTLWLHLFNVPRLSRAVRRALCDAFGVETSGSVVQAFRAGVAYERSTRAARRKHARALRRRHGLRLVPPVAGSASTSATPVTEAS